MKKYILKNLILLTSGVTILASYTIPVDGNSCVTSWNSETLAFIL